MTLLRLAAEQCMPFQIPNCRSPAPGQVKQLSKPFHDLDLERRKLRLIEFPASDKVEGNPTGFTKLGFVAEYVGDLQRQVAMLPRPQDVARAAQTKIGLGHREAVGMLLQSLQTL